MLGKFAKPSFHFSYYPLFMTTYLLRVGNLACFLLLNLSLMATTYYVSPSGSDGQTGLSPANAWQTLAHVNTQQLLAGDTLALLGGAVHAGNLVLDVNDAGGGSMSPLTITAYGTGRAVISAGLGFGIDVWNTAGIVIRDLEIQGDGLLTNTASGIRFRNTQVGDTKLNYILIEEVEVLGFGENGISIEGEQVNSGFSDVFITQVEVHDCRDRGINMIGDYDQFKTGYAHQHVRVTHCEVYDIPGYNKGEHSGNGIVLADLQDGLIEYSVAHHCGTGNTSCGGPVGIWFWDSDSVTIQHCEAYLISSGTGCDGGGFDLDGGVSRGLMQYNYSHDNDGPGYLVGQFGDARPMQDIVVRYNVSENDAQTNRGSITLFRGSTTPISDIYIYQNTCFLTPSASYPTSAVFEFVEWRRITGIQVFNNIFYAANAARIIVVPAGYAANFQGNAYYADGPFTIDYRGSTYNSLANFRSGAGQETLGGVPVGVEGDPGLSTPGGGGTIGFGNSLTNLAAYRLTSGAGALNGGIDLVGTYALDVGNQDFFGNSPSNSGEIGADQTGAPFAVTWVDWRGEQQANGVRLFWETAEEQVGQFSIEHKGEGQSWSSVGLIDASDKQEIRQSFTFFHPLTSSGTHAFRVKHTYPSGASEYSSVLVFSLQEPLSSLSICPNPVLDVLTIKGISMEKGGKVSIYDAYQRPAFSQMYQAGQVGTDLTLSLPSLPAGIYYLTVHTGSKRRASRFIKQ